jgi:hypothetical protein
MEPSCSGDPYDNLTPSRPLAAHDVVGVGSRSEREQRIFLQMAETGWGATLAADALHGGPPQIGRLQAKAHRDNAAPQTLE